MNGNGYYATGSSQLRSERHYVSGESGNIRRRYVVDSQPSAGGVQTLRKPVTADNGDDDIRCEDCRQDCSTNHEGVDEFFPNFSGIELKAGQSEKDSVAPCLKS